MSNRSAIEARPARQWSHAATIERLTREHVLVHLRAACVELGHREARAPSGTGVGGGS
jgi:hypothetical protein